MTAMWLFELRATGSIRMAFALLAHPDWNVTYVVLVVSPPAGCGDCARAGRIDAATIVTNSANVFVHIDGSSFTGRPLISGIRARDSTSRRRDASESPSCRRRSGDRITKPPSHPQTPPHVH